LRKNIVTIFILILCLSLFAGCGLFVTKYYLTVGIEGEGSVMYDPPQEDRYAEGTEVTLTAVPDDNWLFSHWKGDIESTEAEIVVEMDEDKNLTAVFERMDFELDIDIIGEGEVKVVEVIEPASLEYPYETRVKLEAVPAAGWDFKKWEGDLTGTDPEAEIIMDEDKSITAEFKELPLIGHVTDARGGSGIEGAVVKGNGLEVTTDAQGFFALDAETGKKFDLIIEKEGYGSAKIQDLMLEEDEVVHFNVPCRPAFSSTMSTVPMTIGLDGIDEGDKVEDVVNFTVTTQGDNALYALFGFFNNENIGFESEIFTELDEAVFSWDTTLYPNGPGYLLLHAYDLMGNITIKRVFVEIDNDEVEVEEPEDAPFLMTYSMTWGMNPRFHAEERAERYEELGIEKDPFVVQLPHGFEFDIRTAPEGAALYNVIIWSLVADATGYSVYRSFDGSEFHKIADIVGDDAYFDFCAQLEVGKETYYKVVPYNSKGEGNASAAISTTPLPPFNVFLEGPADGELDVSLSPTFSWMHDGNFAEDVVLSHSVWLYEATEWKIWEEDVVDEEEITFPGVLKAQTVYTWDVFGSRADIDYYDGTDGVSFAISFAGERDGSMNGEFIFTTGQ